MSTRTTGYEADETRRLSPEELASGFMEASRALWCVAAGVLGRRDGADDVLQEAIMIALTKIDAFDASTNLIAWLARIVRFTALNHARRRQRNPITAIEPESLDTHRAPLPAGDEQVPIRPDGTLAEGQDAFDDAVLEALQSLDDTPRACLLLRTTLEMQYRDIARVLDIPEGTAMSHVHRARKTIKARLGDDARESARREESERESTQ